MKKLLKYILAIVSVISTIGMTVCAAEIDPTGNGKKILSLKSIEDPVVIGIAWREDVDSEFYTNVETAIRETGVVPVMLNQATVPYVPYEGNHVSSKAIDKNDVLKLFYGRLVRENTYKYTDMASLLKGIDAVVFTGGEDIAPSLYKRLAVWHGIEAEKDYNATRDISDYITMAYCLDNDIPILGLCRGSQMLAVISECDVVQDIETFYKEQGVDYDFVHRNNKATPDSYRDYAPHTIEILDTGSILYGIVGNENLEGCPSWHHQAADISKAKNLKLTAVTTSAGISITEATERTDQTFALGLQFHPEAAIVKNMNNADNKGNYMSYENAMRFFNALKEAVRVKRIIDLAA